MNPKSPLPALLPRPSKNEPARLGAALDSIPEAEGWDPISGSGGHRVPESPSDDEDDEGHNESAQLVEEGILEAERDQAVQAARAAKKTGWREP
jgi:hypothetical protein